MVRNDDMIDIIHGGSPHSSIVPLEPHRFDKIDSRAQTGGEPQNGANIPSDFRLEQRNPHGDGVSQSLAILND